MVSGDKINDVDEPHMANAKANVVFEKEKKGECFNSVDENHEVLRKERLSLLEDYGNKLCNNLQSLKKNQMELMKEKEYLSQVLDLSQKCTESQMEDQNVSYTNQNFNQCMEECNVSTQCYECISCDSVSWHQSVENIRDNEKCSSTNTLTLDNCTCHETSSTTDSENSCECQNLEEEQFNDDYQCTCKDQSIDFLSSNSSNEEGTLFRKKSECTFLNKNNESPENLPSESEEAYIKKIFTHNVSTNRSRDSFNTINVKTRFLSAKKNSKLQNRRAIYRNTTLNHLKLINVDEVRQSLQRLKVRNRNLKNFLSNLEDPVNFVNEKSEVSGLCTAVSSYTLDLEMQTHSGLINVAKVLENKCRNKDVIIAALADELRINDSTKLRFKKDKPKPEETRVRKRVDGYKKLKKKFNAKDSVFGFIILGLILISYAKISDVMFYLQIFKKNLLESFTYLFLFVKQTDRFFPYFLLTYYKKLNKNVISRCKGKFKLLDEYLKLFREEIYGIMDSAVIFLIEYQHYIGFISSVILSIFLVIKLRKVMANNFKVSNSVQYENLLKLCQTTKAITVTYTNLLFNRVLSSKIFWITLGYSSHFLLKFLQPDFIKFIDSITSNYSEKM